MNRAPSDYTTAGTLMLIAGALNALSAFGWATSMVISFLFICLAPFYLLPLTVAIFEIICGVAASGGRPSPRIKLVSILGLVASLLMLNPVTIVLEIVALIHLSRPEVGDWLRVNA